ncbi:LON peptidase N-terminal domain and RING finger protein 3 [Porphyridium purpureum]|uniref:LON peptidase N-terminal domain and RING finger protein 3 n=1 Tax=Porphyridium purpureum TaxID=35688 RepID=A0A5J4YJ93_PORPP|nr:LON peptidase N-terminal domain and RING finger protein 3 [Porphyridium purpureum]|eukprot:POR9791..scf291_13
MSPLGFAVLSAPSRTEHACGGAVVCVRGTSRTVARRALASQTRARSRACFRGAGALCMSSEDGQDEGEKEDSERDDARGDGRLFGEPGMRPEDIEFMEAIGGEKEMPSSVTGLPTGRLVELPLFPLGLVLYPKALVPLHIFEMRYRRMFGQIREKDNMFGIVMYDSSRKRMARVGCSAECQKVQLQDDGRMLVINQGQQRFRIIKVLQEAPYITALVEYFQDEPPRNDIRQAGAGVWQSLQEVLRLSNKLYNKGLDVSDELKKLAPVEENMTGSTEEQFKKLEDFSFGIGSILDMPTEEQQILLQTRDTEKRLRKQKELLDAAQQQLAAQISIKSALENPTQYDAVPMLAQMQVPMQTRRGCADKIKQSAIKPLHSFLPATRPQSSHVAQPQIPSSIF